MAERLLNPLLSFSAWKSKFGRSSEESIFGVWDDYQRYRAGYTPRQETYETPAEAANRMAEEEWQAGIGLLGASREQYQQLGGPSDIATQYMINQEAERNAAAASRDISRLRGRAAASGMGRTGATGRREELIRSEMTRRNIMGARDIRVGVRSERLAGLERTTGAAAAAHLGRTFQLPESGAGQVAQRSYQNYDWLYGTQKRPQALSTLRPPTGTSVIGFG